MGLAFSAETEVFFEWAALFFWRNCDLISSILKSGKPLGADHLKSSDAKAPKCCLKFACLFSFISPKWQ